MSAKSKTTSWAKRAQNLNEQAHQRAPFYTRLDSPTHALVVGAIRIDRGQTLRYMPSRMQNHNPDFCVAESGGTGQIVRASTVYFGEPK